MFKGVARDKDIKLKWRTANEFDVVGFNVWRRTGRDGTFVKMNTNLIPADSPGGKLGARYVFKDMTALAGTKYFYKLELSDGVNAVELSDIIRVRKPPSQ
jgi:hypothetical protein